jgi:hypothetical protein
MSIGNNRTSPYCTEMYIIPRIKYAIVVFECTYLLMIKQATYPRPPLEIRQRAWSTYYSCPIHPHDVVYRSRPAVISAFGICDPRLRSVGCVLYSRSIETELGYPTIVPLIGPLIGRAHANLGWSPQAHDAIYIGLRGRRKD